MASTAAEAKVGSKGLFVRNATGLVRELNAFDAFNLVFSAVLIPVGITQVMGFTPQFWPHANMLASFAIATPLVLCFGLVYLYFTQLMPRSGGDYVWVSRTLHPSLGFLVNFSLTFVFLTWVAFNFTFMLSVVGPAASYVAGIHNHWFTSPTKNEMMVVATVLTTLYAMVYCFQVYTGFQWTGYFAGEIKNARRTAVTSILGGLVASAAIYMLGVGLIYKYYGYKFFGSLVWLGLGGGSDHNTLSFSPYLAALANFLPGPHWFEIFVALCFVLAILWWTPTGFMLGTRNMFAWSFDRLAPEKLTTVSDRFHTPVIATITIGCVVELLNYLNIYQGLGAYLLNLIAVMALAFIVVSFSAIIAPWRRPKLRAQGPGWARARFLGLPVITWVAAISAISWIFVVDVAFHTGFGGTFGFKPMLEAFTAPLIGVVYYIGVRLYRRSQGMQLKQTFAEIPPE